MFLMLEWLPLVLERLEALSCRGSAGPFRGPMSHGGGVGSEEGREEGCRAAVHWDRLGRGTELRAGGSMCAGA